MSIDSTATIATVGAPRPPRRRPATRGFVVSDAMLPAAVVLWLVAVNQTRADAVGSLGLLSALPLIYFVAVGVVIISAVSRLVAPAPSQKRLFLHVVVLVVMLYGTAPLVYAEPRYAWVYKHIGVVEFITSYHHLERHIDIFHSWPGFFAAAAVFVRVAGISSPMEVAAWAQTFFALLNVLMVNYAARALSLSWRERWLALLIFSGANWIAQDYFSPQAAAFVLSVGILAMALHCCRADDPPRWLRKLSKRVRALVRAPIEEQPATAESTLPRPRVLVTAVLAIVLAQCALVVMHELSPYVVAIDLCVLTIFGQIRPRWLAPTLLAIPVAYLIPRFSYVNSTYGLLDSLGSFFSNARPPSALGLHLAYDQQLVAQAARALSIFVWALAVVGAWRRLRAGRPVLVLTLLAFVPFFLLFLHGYGGEALLRVELFSLPWSACLAASAVGPELVRGPRRGRVLSGTCLAVIVALFLPAYFGNDEINQSSTSAVAASRYLYTKGDSGAVLYLDLNFPLSNGARYYQFFPTVFLVDEHTRRPVTLRGADVPSITGIARSVSSAKRKAYLVLTPGMLKYARAYGLSRSQSLRSLEKGLDASPDWRVFYRDGETAIYQLE
jgi:hypothetical protein